MIYIPVFEFFVTLLFVFAIGIVVGIIINGEKRDEKRG